MEIIKDHLIDYEIFDNIGSGSYGLVYKGRNRTDNQEVAIKCFTIGNNLFKNYLNELKFVFRLRHPNIVKVFDVYSGDIYHYIIYEFMNNGNLRDQITDNKISNIKDVIKIIKDISLALSYVHGNNVAHRDLKPENILISQENNQLIYKIADFGVSKSSLEAYDLSTNIGSPAYMSPEQFKGHYDKRSDIYSLGIIFYELLYGKRPFSGSLADIMNGHLNDNPEFENLKTDNRLIEILKKILEKDTNIRYQDGYDIYNDLCKLEINDDDLVKKSNLRLLNIDFPTNYQQIEEIEEIEKIQTKNLGSRVRKIEFDDNESTIVINDKNVLIYDNNLNVQSYISEDNICWVFKDNIVFFIKEQFLFKLEKNGEVFDKIKILEFNNKVIRFYHCIENRLILTVSSNNQIIIYSYDKNKIDASFEIDKELNIQSLILKNDKIYLLSETDKKTCLFIYSIDGIILEKYFIENTIKLQADKNFVYLISYNQNECKVYKFLDDNSYSIYCFNFEKLKSIEINNDKIVILNKENKIFFIENDVLSIGKNINLGDITGFKVLENRQELIFVYKIRESLKLSLINYADLFSE